MLSVSISFSSTGSFRAGAACIGATFRVVAGLALARITPTIDKISLSQLARLYKVALDHFHVAFTNLGGVPARPLAMLLLFSCRTCWFGRNLQLKLWLARAASTPYEGARCEHTNRCRGSCSSHLDARLAEAAARRGWLLPLLRPG